MSQDIIKKDLRVLMLLTLRTEAEVQLSLTLKLNQLRCSHQFRSAIKFNLARINKMLTQLLMAGVTTEMRTFSAPF